MYLYDITRLIYRTVDCVNNRSLYTGIDRVDLQYAMHFQKKGAILLIQYENIFYKVSDKSIKKLFDLSARIMSSKIRCYKISLSTFFIPPKSKKYSNIHSKLHTMFNFVNKVSKIELPERHKYVNSRKDDLYTKISNRFIVNIAVLLITYFPSFIKLCIKICLFLLRKLYTLLNFHRSKKEITWLEECLKNIIDKKYIVYINASHYGLNDKRKFLWLLSKIPVKFVFFVHDLIPLTNPETVRESDPILFRKSMENVNQFADMVIFSSNYVKRIFFETCMRLSIYNSSINFLVIKLGLEGVFTNKNNLSISRLMKKLLQQLDGNYFVYISTIEPRKNHDLLIRLWMRETEKSENWPFLILVGKYGWLNENVRRLLERGKNMEKVIHLPSVIDNDLYHLILQSRACLFPSFVEGYGLPVSEAMSLGKSVICSDISVFREFFHDTAELVDPLDTEAWKSLIIDYSSKESLLRIRQENNIKKIFKPFSWEEHFYKLDKELTKYYHT